MVVSLGPGGDVSLPIFSQESKHSPFQAWAWTSRRRSGRVLGLCGVTKRSIYWTSNLCQAGTHLCLGTYLSFWSLWSLQRLLRSGPAWRSGPKVQWNIQWFRAVTPYAPLCAWNWIFILLLLAWRWVIVVEVPALSAPLPMQSCRRWKTFDQKKQKFRPWSLSHTCAPRGFYLSWWTMCQHICALQCCAIFLVLDCESLYCQNSWHVYSDGV